MTHSDIIYVDFSILSTFRQCEEKGRLSYVEHYQPLQERAPLSFGSAFHAGIAEFYKSLARGNDRVTSATYAKKGFIADLRNINSCLPISMESDEKRSVERGLTLLDAYIETYKNENYENYCRPDTGEPYVEIGFAVYFMDWRGTPVVYVGRIDRIMRNRVDGRLYNFETKTTASGLTQYVKQVRPNHQVTGYHFAAREMLKLDVVGTVWDCIFVSDRQPKPDSSDVWLQRGIDIKKDLARHETRRSATDIEEFLYDLEMTTTRYLTLRESTLRRWTRNAPTACHMYGGCQFVDVCSTNLNENVLRTKFVVKPWEPWKGITEGKAQNG